MDEDIKHGFILQNNKLYQAVPESGNKGGVKAGRVLLDYATVVNSTIKTGDNHHSVNRVFEKFSNIYDANLNRNQLHTEPFVVVGGASKKATVSTWARAYGRFSLEIGAKSLDNPLGFLEEYLDMTELNNSKFVKNKPGGNLNEYLQLLDDKMNKMNNQIYHLTQIIKEYEPSEGIGIFPV